MITHDDDNDDEVPSLADALMPFPETSLGSFSISVQDPKSKFSSAHFVCFDGYRERLHGHNYTTAVKLEGTRPRHDGYVVDFGDVKKAMRELCKELNERLLVPSRSPVLSITQRRRVTSLPPSSRSSGSGSVGSSGGGGGLTHLPPRCVECEQVEMWCQDGTYFSVPGDDCALLPIAHSTAEEIAALLWMRLLRRFGERGEGLRRRGVRFMEVSVSETPHQTAVFRCAIPQKGPAGAEAMPPVKLPPAGTPSPATRCSEFRVTPPTAGETAEESSRAEAAAGTSHSS